MSNELMRVSLDEFLKTGMLGDLRFGMNKSEVVALLGPPDAEGIVKAPQSHIWWYGQGIELYFSRQKTQFLEGIYVTWLEKGAPFSFPPSLVVVDWPMWELMEIDKVKAKLESLELSFLIHSYDSQQEEFECHVSQSNIAIYKSSDPNTLSLSSSIHFQE